jgi:hypothetical protein
MIFKSWLFASFPLKKMQQTQADLNSGKIKFYLISATSIAG